MKVRPGILAFLAGLKDHAYANGRVVKVIEFVPAIGRWQVQSEGSPFQGNFGGTTQLALVRECHLIPIDAQPDGQELPATTDLEVTA